MIGGLAAKFDCGHVVADGDALDAVVAPDVGGVVIAFFALLFSDVIITVNSRPAKTFLFSLDCANIIHYATYLNFFLTHFLDPCAG